jgi:putative salt-induced outer membrane protein YdiY
VQGPNTRPRIRAAARRGIFPMAIVLAFIALTTGPTRAEMAPPDPEVPAELIEGENFEPRGDDFAGPDWIQLNSGEWLQGSVDRIRDRQLEFDSDELDELTFDFADVFAVVTAGPHTLNFEGRRIVTGRVAIRGDVVRVRSGDIILTFTRHEIVGMVPGRPREINYWSGSVSFGLTLQRGNSNQTDLTALANITRETALTRANAKYNGSLGKVGAQDTANNHRVTGRGDVFLTRRFYLTPLSFEYFTDPFQNVDLRLTPSAGVGYRLVDRSRVDLDVTVAAGAQYTRDVASSFPGADRDRTTAAIIMGMDFETDPTERLEWDGEFKVQLGVPDTSETNYHALTTISVDVWGDLDLDLTFVWDRNQSPSTRPDGTVPKQNDYRLSAGIGWDF